MVSNSPAPSEEVGMAGETEQMAFVRSTGDALNGIPSPPSFGEDANDSNQQNLSTVSAFEIGPNRSTAGVLDGIPSLPSSAADGHGSDQRSLVHATNVATAATKLKKNSGELEPNAETVQPSHTEDVIMAMQGTVEEEGQSTSTGNTIVQFASSGDQEESTNVGIALGPVHEESNVEVAELLVGDESPLLEGDGIANRGGEAHGLLQPGADEQLGDLPQAAVAPVAAAHLPPAVPPDAVADLPGFDLYYMGTPSQAEYLQFMNSFPELENGAVIGGDHEHVAAAPVA